MGTNHPDIREAVIGGAGFNPSLSVGRAARGKATTRTPVHFYLDVPMYRVELPCMSTFDGQPHIFLSRTAPWPGGVAFQPLWCDRCKTTRWLNPMTTPVHVPDRMVTDWHLAAAQDKGILRERISTWLARNAWRAWDAEGEADLYRDAVERFGVTLTEVKRLMTGIVRSPSMKPAAALCKLGEHEMTNENTEDGGRCKACRREAQRKRRKAKK